MNNEETRTTVGQLRTSTAAASAVPKVLTTLAWILWVASIGALVAFLRAGGGWTIPGLVRVDGLTVALWLSVTFFSGIVHSYSRRYMAGSAHVDRFFGRVFAFTLVVMVLVAADNLALFAAAWLAMGLVMADLVGHVDNWSQAQAAGSLARRYFLGSSAALAVALATLSWTTGATTISGIASTVTTAPTTPVLVAAAALVLAATIQSALVPFHTWLLSSLTAPTPASALMHAGFVNAGGILLTRFAPVVTVDDGVMLAIVVVGATSALGGKLLKTVQTDVKGTLGCSTVGQMGFMIVQAGLGYFAAAVTHLVLHGFYKAYQFLASGGQVTRNSPVKSTSSESTTVPGVAVGVLTALAGGVLFAALTGKGATLDSGLLLTGLVVLTVIHGAREVVTEASLPATVRYGAFPLVALPAITVYAVVYGAVDGLLAGLPALGEPEPLTVVHGLVAVAFLAAYVAIERGSYRRSRRLYVALVNATQPPTETLLTSTEESDDN
jgi:NAD(P)H-quinone oxidoreductase subunit 5